ncbi:MAG: 8-amino-7-oxononanoate synthase [Gammaproteobacteria bacterium]|nr:8-amino-7-oxononanoate synthase [Gammaproteobacteria bacterium]
MSSLDDALKPQLYERRAQQHYRRRRILESPQGTHVRIDGRSCLSFCSNDYLGMANHPEVVAALRDGATKYGVGSGASHLVCGHSDAHHDLEEALASLTGRPRALLFSSGYMANMGVIAALTNRHDTIFEDRLNHASLLDGALLSRARLQRYAHGSVAQLDAQLSQSTSQRKLVVSDGVFSMDGDLAPLTVLAQTAQQHDAWLMVDDAHGMAVLGPSGAGVCEQLALSLDEVPILVGTLGKGFGTFGAFVAGSETLIEALIQQAHTYIYTTALPPAVAHATRVSLRCLQEEPWRRSHLRELIDLFRSGAAALGLALADSMTPIQPLIVGDSGHALALSEQLLARGILIAAIRPPTVPVGSARLRITLSAEHSEADVTRLLEVLGDVMDEMHGDADSAAAMAGGS